MVKTTNRHTEACWKLNFLWKFPIYGNTRFIETSGLKFIGIDETVCHINSGMKNSIIYVDKQHVSLRALIFVRKKIKYLRPVA